MKSANQLVGVIERTPIRRESAGKVGGNEPENGLNVGESEGTSVQQTGALPSAAAAAAEPSAPAWPDHGPDGKFLPGNLAAVKHALRTDRLPPELACLTRDIQRFVDGCTSDEGDASDVSTRRRSLLNYRARVHRRIIQLDAAIETQGLFSRDGKLRIAWLQQLENLISCARALDSLLGLAKRQKSIPTLEQYLQQRAAEPDSEAPPATTEDA